MEQSPLPKADMRWLAGYVGRHRGAAIGALATGVVAGATSALEPYLAGIVIDAIRTGGDVLSPILLMLALGAVGVVAFFRQRYYSGVVVYMVTYDIRKTLFENLLTREHAFFLEHPTGDLISRMRADIDVIWRLLALTFTRFGSAAFSLVLTFILLATISLPLTLVVFVVLMVSSAFQARAGVRLARIFEDVQTQEGALAAFAQDAFSGIQTIKTFGREEGAAAHYAAANDTYRKTWLYFRRRNEPVGMLPNAIAELTAGIVVLAGGVLTLNGALTLGDFARFLISLNLISVVLLQLGTIYQRAQQARGALARLTPLLQPAQIQDMDLNTKENLNHEGTKDTKEHEGERKKEEFNAEAQRHRGAERELNHGGTEGTEITEENGVGTWRAASALDNFDSDYFMTTPIGDLEAPRPEGEGLGVRVSDITFRGAITFERVGVRASARDSLPPTIRERMALNTHEVVHEGEESWLLRDVSLHIPAGAVVGFVGATGSGKTLLLSLLARVLDPDEGRVLLDGRDVRTLPLDDLRGAIAYVPQTTFLFSMPLRENVRLGNLSLEDDLLERALHISRMSNDLPQLPQGLETLVGEKGVMLSGGQKQRVAIARAIVRDPAVLVLDDALSSVDTQTAADILADLRQVLRSRTSLIVAHRMATVKDADLIVVMQKGRIVEQGTHAALLAREGLYAQMWQREAEEV